MQGDHPMSEKGAVMGLQPVVSAQGLVKTFGSHRSVDEILVGEMIWCGTKSLFSGIAILAVATLLGVVDGWQALWVLPVVFLIGLCFGGMAMVMSAFATNYDFFNYYFVLAITPMFILSGVFYPVDSLPELAQGAVQLLPLTHAVAMTRPLVAGGELTMPLLHIGVLLLYGGLGFYISVVLVRKRLLV